MKIYKAYKTELDPNNVQKTAFLKHSGAARWVYNWALAKKIEAYKETGKSPDYVELSRELTKLKKLSKEDGGASWLYNVSARVQQEALRDLDQAYKNFFRRCKQKTKKKGFPKFKSRKNKVGNFTLIGSIYLVDNGSYIKLPRVGKIRLKEKGYLPESGVKILSATISEKAGKWFVSLNVEENIKDPEQKSGIVGVDVGIKQLATTSNGEVFENPRALSKSLKRLRMLNKSLSRKKKGSNNRKKAKNRLARQHYRISCIRKDAIHKATTTIVKSAGVIVIEDLNVAGMLKNRRLSKSLSDASLSEFHRQLEYKAIWNGSKIVKADKFYPSSKRCSNCGHVKKDLKLSDRVYHCEQCGIEIDRDLNAALNLKSLAVSSTVVACCHESSGITCNTKLSFGQEVNINLRVK